jgi:peptidyl-prolyl cis-trans isomerase D
MLNVLRKHATSWIIKVALGLIVIVFISWGGYSYKDREAGRLAKVYEQYITYNEYRKVYDQLVENYRRQLGKAFSQDFIEKLKLKDQALDLLINQHIVTRAAGELGLTTTPQEIQNAILRYPVFQNQGKFDQVRYVELLRMNQLTPEMFEQQLSEELLQRKVEAFIKRQAAVGEEEVRADLEFNSTRIQLAYVMFDPKDYENKVKIETDQLEAFYREHANEYQDPEKRQFALVVLKLDHYLPSVKVTDEEIKRYYEDNPKKYRQEGQVRARHILFKLSPDATGDQVAKVRAEAEKVLTEAKNGADFAELAKKYSQDPSAPQGGDLGFFSREKMVPEFSDAAFKMKPGEISALVRSSFGLHIIKVEEVRPEQITALETVRSEIELTLKRDKARNLARIDAQDLADKAYADKEVQKPAQARNLEVQKTPWLSQKDPLPNLGPAAQAMQKLFALAKGEISGALESQGNFIVAQVQDIQAPAVMPFETAKEQVTKDFTAEQARQMAEQEANQLLQLAGKLNSLEEAAKRKHVPAKKSQEFSRIQPDETLRLQPPALNEVFLLLPSRPFPEAALAVGNGYMACQLLSKNGPGPETLSEQRAPTWKKLYEEKQAQIWELWLEQQRQKAGVQLLQKL